MSTVSPLTPPQGSYLFPEGGCSMAGVAGEPMRVGGVWGLTVWRAQGVEETLNPKVTGA